MKKKFALLNQWMEQLGQEAARWLVSDLSAFLCCTVVNLWLALPFMIMIMDGAMQSIDQGYEESALLDGASWLQRTRYIIVPAIRPIIAPAVIITVFTTFKQFDVVYLLTQQTGAKTGSGFHTILTYAYENAFITNNYGYSSAMLTRYRAQLLPAQLNLLDSHDVSRFLSLCGGDVRPYRLAILFMMSFVGMPTIFYGDELGVRGVLEEEYRAPMPWQGGDMTLRSFFQRAISMRRELAPLRRGDFRVLSAQPGSKLLVFCRRFGGEKVTVCLNCWPEPADLPPLHGTAYWSEERENGRLAGFGFAILVDGHS